MIWRDFLIQGYTAHTHMYIRVDNIIRGRCNSAYNAAYDKHAHKKVNLYRSVVFFYVVHLV